MFLRYDSLIFMIDKCFPINILIFRIFCDNSDGFSLTNPTKGSLVTSHRRGVAPRRGAISHRPQQYVAGSIYVPVDDDALSDLYNLHRAVVGGILTGWDSLSDLYNLHHPTRKQNESLVEIPFRTYITYTDANDAASAFNVEIPFRTYITYTDFSFLVVPPLVEIPFRTYITYTRKVSDDETLDVEIPFRTYITYTCLKPKRASILVVIPSRIDITYILGR